MESLSAEAASWDEYSERQAILRQVRLFDLNLRDSNHRDPQRFSGASANYGVSYLRLLTDRAHLARIQGDVETQAALRNEVLERTTELAAVSGATGALALGEVGPEWVLLNNLSYVRAELEGDLSVAVEEASRSVSVQANPLNLDTLGWIEIKRGNLERGVEYLREAVFDPDNLSAGTTYYHLGVAYDEMGQREKAEFYFREALRLDLEWWEEIDLFERCPHCPPSGGDSFAVNTR